MQKGCDRFYDMTEVHRGYSYSYKGNGQDFLIRFQGYNNDPGQFEMVDSEITPVGGTNVTFYSNTTIPYSTNLFYDPVPFEFIRTYEEEP